jgi:hypothetical protein
MRFMMLMIPGGYEKAKAGTMPDPKAIAVMDKYNKSLEKAGVLLGAEGLHPPSMGARIVFSGGKTRVVDGPFPDLKETLGGFWIIRVKSIEEAIAWALKCPAGEKDVIEIRQVQEEYEFGDAEKAESTDFAEMKIKAR